MKITIDIEGIDTSVNHLRKIRQELEGGRGSLYTDISQIVEMSIEQNFNAGGRPAWPPRKRVYSHPILDKTGAMRDQAASSAKTWQHSQSEHHIDIKSTSYAVFHQYGTSQLPVRKFAKLIDSEVQAIIRRIKRVFQDE